MSPHAWRVPKDLSGVFQVVPRIDTGPLKSIVLPREIRIRDGKWEEKPAGAAGDTPVGS